MIDLVQQPTPWSCVHACLSMVTGIPVQSILERFPIELGLSRHEEFSFLMSNGFIPEPLSYRFATPWPFVGLYLVTLPSLNQKASTHRCVLRADSDVDDWLIVYDPNTGRQGVEIYPTDAALKGPFPASDVVFIHKQCGGGK